MIRTEIVAPVCELLRRQAERFPDKVAFSDDGSAVTYTELDRMTVNLATQLRALGLVPGGTVAIWLPNSVDWVISCLAIVRAGGVAVPISYEATSSEVSYRIEDAACRFIVSRVEKEAATGAVETRILVGAQAPGTVAFEALCAAPATGIALEPDDIDRVSYLVYTSGTTGKAKGVMLTTRSMLWVVAACWAPILGMDCDDRVLSPLPLFHSYALNISVLGIIASGASEHIMERFSTQGTLDRLAGGEFTLLPGVPTMFHYLLQAAEKAGQTALPGLRRCVSAGAIMPAGLNRDFEAYFGVELLDGYGITETSTMVTMNWPGKNRVHGSCGLPVPGLAVRLISPASGLDVATGEEGELVCRGPNLMLGYHNKPVDTDAVLRNGWYHTGDLARSDENGFLTITGRLKEIIIRGGQNIAPAEVEEAILPFAGVGDCAVVGVAHATLGEVPVAFVVPKEGARIEETILLEHCRTVLSAYKVPAAVHIVPEIPRTGSGKIMRFKLRNLVETTAA
ncbi:long-chain fatty acid--CoA ligase [Pseudaminobacter arsenicus]|uniref:Long-chain fatty acid--CoA ligase n=1 Tax=Borborobacter arsenicus TaxID=1851146 RepID=A0A432V3M6_9HYPH|nr:AMP-binding protein [Pseudaminobacter arsenicus]RUM96642.1 long-chain fatty acid--CoA ligase [Pseudaminobacter arsenicus]